MCLPKCAVVLLALTQVVSSVDKLGHIILDERQAAFTKKLDHFHIVVPTEVDKNGGFISHVVQHSAEHTTRGLRVDELHYHVAAFGEKLHLQLTGSTLFIGPGMVIEEGSSLRQYNQSCHYTGRLMDEPGSRVFVSNCRGLEGVIQRLDGDHIFIEPISGHDNTSQGGQHAHLIYRRSAVATPKPDHATGCDIHDKVTLEMRKKEPYLELIRENKHDRQRRSVSTERNVEVLVVADRTMYEFHQDSLEDYLLTVMNMVNNIFHDPSIGNAINIVVVRIIILKEDQPGLAITHHAGDTIEQFCKWASSLNPKGDSHPNHHDLAILVTRRDICKGINEPCGTLGLAQVNGLCTREKSCNVNEDSGLAVAYTIAHEIGHNLGMLHDGDNNDCNRAHGTSYLMSPLLQTTGKYQFWSKCSREYVRRFLNKGWGWCLNDAPSSHPEFNSAFPLPGTIYDADHQCRLQYGANSSHCTNMADMCSTLWCKAGRACQSKLEPSADGTACEEGKWCYRGECIKKGKIPQSVDGGWGPWSNWSQCSRTCGGGVSFSERRCDNPRPVHDGKYCIGKWKKYKLCSVQECRAGAEDFREMQCSKFNTRVIRNRKWSWKPKLLHNRPCELHCVPKGIYRLYFNKKFADEVVDGTKCFPAKRDVCIGGRCEHVGCDNVLHSNAKDDRCGVCRGDGTSCETVTSMFNQTTGIGYVETKVIPEGARNIKVEEVAGAPNYLALRSATGKYYLNGHWYIQWSGEYEAAGTTVRYTRKHNKETFQADGPTHADLHIMLLFQTRNPGIKFEYTIPKKNVQEFKGTLLFKWRYTEWTRCSSSCGVGTTRSEVECYEQTGNSPVDEKYCNGTARPDDKQRTCNENPCPATWYRGPWQTCSKTCGQGASVRTVLCVRSIKNDEQVALKDDACRKPKPPLVRRCYRRSCPPPWSAKHWSKCSASCDRGIQRRLVSCKSIDVSKKPCDKNSKPITWRYCNTKDCVKKNVFHFSRVPVYPRPMDERNVVDREHNSSKPLPHGAARVVTCKGGQCRKWFKGIWSKCSVRCGRGIQTRRVYCAGSHRYCDPRVKPAKHRTCRMKPCLAWRAGPWTKCSVTCGSHGNRKRIVKCYNKETGRETGGCTKLQKPNHYEKCTTKKCPAEEQIKASKKKCGEFGKDTYFCKLVGLHGFCKFSHWRKRCCRTCAGWSTSAHR